MDALILDVIRLRIDELRREIFDYIENRIAGLSAPDLTLIRDELIATVRAEVSAAIEAAQNAAMAAEVAETAAAEAEAAASDAGEQISEEAEEVAEQVSEAVVTDLPEALAAEDEAPKRSGGFWNRPIGGNS